MEITHVSPASAQDTRSTSGQDLIENRNYSLNHEKSLDKKKKATTRIPINVFQTSGGLRIVCNAGTFEHLKKEMLAFYGKYRNYDQLSAKIIQCFDTDSNEPEVKIKVTYSNSHTSFTINVYNTTSSYLVNGKGLTRFQTRDLPLIIANLDLSSDLNDQIHEALKSCSTRKCSSGTPRGTPGQPTWFKHILFTNK
jgi:hypothetical protein